MTNAGRFVSAALAAAVPACAGAPDPGTPAPAAAVHAASTMPGTRVAWTRVADVTGTIAVLGLDFPDPGPIGTHLAGVNFPVRAGTIHLTDGTRRNWTLAAALRIAARLDRLGYAVAQGAMPTSDAVLLEGVRFALTGRITDLAIEQTGSTGPLEVDVRVEISWELLDLLGGASVAGLRVAGRAHMRDSLSAAVLLAVDRSLVGAFHEPSFLAALAAPAALGALLVAGPDATARPLTPTRRLVAGMRETIRLTTADLNVLADTSLVLQLAAGVVTLTSADANDETAFLITRDGLALTTGRAVAQGRRVFARFLTGVERPVRLLRTGSGGIALVQVDCPGPCYTVPWTTDRGQTPTGVVAVGAPFGGDPMYALARGRTAGARGRTHAGHIRLDVEAGLTGGEPVAREADGQVIAIAASRARSMGAVPLMDAFESLGLEVGPGPDVPR